MLHSNAKNFVYGWAHILDVGWVVSSDGEKIGRVTILKWADTRVMGFILDVTKRVVEDGSTCKHFGI